MNVTKSLTALRFCSKDKLTLSTTVTCQLQLTMSQYNFFGFSFIVIKEIKMFWYLWGTIFLNATFYLKHRWKPEVFNMVAHPIYFIVHLEPFGSSSFSSAFQLPCITVIQWLGHGSLRVWVSTGILVVKTQCNCVWDALYGKKTPWKSNAWYVFFSAHTNSR